MTLDRYADGSWWPNEHIVDPRFPLFCRGNVGEVYPNVVAPLTGSIIAETWLLRTEQRRPDSSARELSGIGVCSGVATGTARVVMDPADPGALLPGDILVAPITDPAWTPLFLAAAGVVVDVGAHLSHAAIVSRELGIPAVVSATGASSTIPDGARVTVDGSRGVVVVHGDS